MESQGRGRGRGGVPLLPTGMWESLNNEKDIEDTVKESEPIDSYDNPESDPSYREADHSRNHDKHKRSDTKYHNNAKSSFDRDSKGKDWDCQSCGNVNWSWRTSCNKCNEPKPSHLYQKDESVVRDGIGGGFHETQGRAANDTVEIDEEGFDDFGRRIKKGSKSDRQAKEEAALRRLNEKYKISIPDPETSLQQSNNQINQDKNHSETSKQPSYSSSTSHFEKNNFSRPNREDSRDRNKRNDRQHDFRRDDRRYDGNNRDRSRDRDRRRNNSRDRPKDFTQDRYKSYDNNTNRDRNRDSRYNNNSNRRSRSRS